MFACRPIFWSMGATFFLISYMINNLEVRRIFWFGNIKTMSSNINQSKKKSSWFTDIASRI